MISQESLTLALRPAPGVHTLDAPDGWRAEAAPIRFELDPGARGFPQGWVLLTGRLSRAIVDGFGVLLAETDAGRLAIEVPVSPVGNVYELVSLPPRIRRLHWQPSRAAGTFRHSALVLRPVGRLERLWLMLRRVAMMLWSQPAARRKEVGLDWRRACVDLATQYRVCGQLRIFGQPMPYAQWIERFDRLEDADREAIRRRLARMRRPPCFAIAVWSAERSAAALAATLASVERQLYPREAVVVLTEVAAPPPARADYVVVLEAGDRLAEHALYWLAEAILDAGDAALVYADEDAMDEAGERSEPRFKPDWSPEHLRSINYLGRGVAFRARELARAGGLADGDPADGGHQLNLRVASALRPEQVVHVPAVLYHRAATTPPPVPRPRARYSVPEKAPLVSIVIPTRDAPRLLRNCVESVRARSSFRRIELVVVDNQSADPAALAYLRELQRAQGVKVLRYDLPFNYSAINNYAVHEARGEVVLLLNNDTEVISEDWLEEMLGHLHRDGVGVVGAKLLFTDGRVQHAGDSFGPGRGADHMHAGIERAAPGYCHRAVVAQEVSAVTGACLMTWRRLYRDLGGLDEEQLAVAFNDVDYCLRVQEAGWRVVFTPHAELFHHESATRGSDLSAPQLARAGREVRVMRRRWGHRLRHDPFYNPNLCYRWPSFTLCDAPRVRKPWLA